MVRASGSPSWIRRLAKAAAAGLVAIVTSCSALGHPTGAAASYPGGASKLAAGEQAVAAAGRYSVKGIVDWPQLPYPQAYKLASVNAAAQAQNAAVALIELGSGITVGSGWTDASGAFTINTGAYVPQVNAFYVIEADKGLGSQLPGNESTRLRTLMQWTGVAWISITNGAPGGQIALDQLTTALAIEVGLGNISAASVIGTVDLSTTPPQLTSTVQTSGVNGHSAAEIDQLATDVKNYILDSLDPVAQVDTVAPTLFTVSPVQGAAGQVVVLNGTGFVAGYTTVDFSASAGGGVAAPILALTPDQIYAQIPGGSTTGNVWVVTSRGTSGNVPFAVTNGAIVTISTITPNPVSLGNTVTILGTNFVNPASANTVTFQVAGGGTTTLPANSGDSASLAVTIPQNAVSGLVHVTNSVGASNNFFLSVSDTGIPTINSVFPTKGVAEQDVILNGILFGNTQGTVTVTDTSGNAYAAQIRYWRDNQVRFTVPWQIIGNSGGSTVNITLYNAAQQAATHTWTALAGIVQNSSWVAGPTLPDNAGIEIVPFWSGTNLYMAGGGGGSNIAELSLNADGGPGTLNASIGSLPITTSSPDLHSHYNTWLGDRYWIFDNSGGPAKCYIQFDPQGNFVTAVNVSPSFELLNGATFFQHDTSICGGPHGIYMAGSDDPGIPVWDNLVYALLDPGNDTIGPWQSVPLPGDANMSNYLDTQDNSCVVLQNNLWRFGYDNASTSSIGPTGADTGSCTSPGCVDDPYFGEGHQEVCPLNADGTPVQAGNSPDGSPFFFTGPSPGYGISPGYHFGGDTVPIGPFIYNFNPYETTDIAVFSPLISGTYPQLNGSAWQTTPENLQLPDAYDAVVVGGYVYVMGGYARASNNVVYYAPID